jgi:hypothetical protein
MNACRYNKGAYNYNARAHNDLITLQVLLVVFLLYRIRIISLAGLYFMKQLKLFKKEKLYQNWDWLYNEYITLDKNTVLIGREQKTTHKVILYWLQKFNIKKDSPLYQDRDWLNNEYWNLKKSEQKIAKEQNVTQANIKYWLIKLNIKRRSIGEALHLLNGNHIDLSSEAIELMEGELLGDGHIQPKNK